MRLKACPSDPLPVTFLPWNYPTSSNQLVICWRGYSETAVGTHRAHAHARHGVLTVYNYLTPLD